MLELNTTVLVFDYVTTWHHWLKKALCILQSVSIDHSGMCYITEAHFIKILLTPSAVIKAQQLEQVNMLSVYWSST